MGPTCPQRAKKVPLLRGTSSITIPSRLEPTCDARRTPLSDFAGEGGVMACSTPSHSKSRQRDSIVDVGRPRSLGYGLLLGGSALPWQRKKVTMS